MHLIGKRVREKEVLRLIGKYLRAPIQRAGKKETRSKGTPQGGPLSPLLANIYLDPLDKELEKRGTAFVRYADDIAIYASSQRSAERILESVLEWLRKELKLEVNRTKSGAGPTEQSGLLGFQISQEGVIRIGDKAIHTGSKKECENSGTDAKARPVRNYANSGSNTSADGGTTSNWRNAGKHWKGSTAGYAATCASASGYAGTRPKDATEPCND